MVIEAQVIDEGGGYHGGGGEVILYTQYKESLIDH